MEQVLATIDSQGFQEKYKCLVMDNCSIYNKSSQESKLWIDWRGYKILFLPRWPSFLSPIEIFWAQLKDFVSIDPSPARLTVTLSDCCSKIIYDIHWVYNNIIITIAIEYRVINLWTITPNQCRCYKIV